MHIFIDHCLPAVYAQVLTPYLKWEGIGEAVALKDKFTQTNMPDVTWIRALAVDAAAHNRQWCFFTRDKKMRRNPAEKKALENSALPGFFFTASFIDQPMNLQLAKIFKLIREIHAETQNCYRQKHPRHFEIPVQANRLKLLSL